MQTALKIGTRASHLAMAQAHEARARLMAAHGLPEEAFEIVPITTTGDRIQNRPLSEAGGEQGSAEGRSLSISVLYRDREEKP